MIFSINETLFKVNNPQIQHELADIIVLLIQDKYLLDFSSITHIFYDDTGVFIFKDSKFAKTFFSNANLLILEEYIDSLLQKSDYLTSEQKKYFSSCTIGLNPGEVSPSVALKLITESSKVILENATNDWNFIKGIASKYSNHKKRKSIYKQVLRAIQNHWLESEQAGGKGQIIARFQDLSANKYQDIYSYKLMALMDSDRDSGVELDVEIKRIIEFFKQRGISDYTEVFYEETDLISWHMLYKRETENYVPLEIIRDKIDLGNLRDDLAKKTDEELDFLKYEKYLPAEVDVKRAFPLLFLENFTRDKLENRCKHHFIDIETPNGTIEQVSEIEQILLKLAKII